jgi:hypothetical protein
MAGFHLMSEYLQPTEIDRGLSKRSGNRAKQQASASYYNTNEKRTKGGL